MPIITIENLQGRPIVFVPDKTTLLSHLLAAGVDWMHACGGNGRCTTCKAIVERGGEQLSPLTIFEQKMIAANRVSDRERLACQCVPTGDVRVRVPPSSQFPHIDYQD